MSSATPCHKSLDFLDVRTMTWPPLRSMPSMQHPSVLLCYDQHKMMRRGRQCRLVLLIQPNPPSSAPRANATCEEHPKHLVGTTMFAVASNNKDDTQSIGYDYDSDDAFDISCNHNNISEKIEVSKEETKLVFHSRVVFFLLLAAIAATIGRFTYKISTAVEDNDLKTGVRLCTVPRTNVSLSATAVR